jgi:hypothetical protein
VIPQISTLSETEYSQYIQSRIDKIKAEFSSISHNQTNTNTTNSPYHLKKLVSANLNNSGVDSYETPISNIPTKKLNEYYDLNINKDGYLGAQGQPKLPNDAKSESQGEMFRLSTHGSQQDKPKIEGLNPENHRGPNEGQKLQRQGSGITGSDSNAGNPPQSLESDDGGYDDRLDKGDKNKKRALHKEVKTGFSRLSEGETPQKIKNLNLKIKEALHNNNLLENGSKIPPSLANYDNNKSYMHGMYANQNSSIHKDSSSQRNDISAEENSNNYPTNRVKLKTLEHQPSNLSYAIRNRKNPTLSPGKERINSIMKSRGILDSAHNSGSQNMSFNFTSKGFKKNPLERSFTLDKSRPQDPNLTANIHSNVNSYLMMNPKQFDIQSIQQRYGKAAPKVPQTANNSLMGTDPRASGQDSSFMANNNNISIQDGSQGERRRLHIRRADY